MEAAFFPLHFACVDPTFLWGKEYMELKEIKVRRLISGNLNLVRED